MTTSTANAALLASVATVTDTSEKEWKYRNLSDKEEEEITHILRKLHGMVYSADRAPQSKADLAPWDQCGLPEYENILNRTFSALKRKGAADAQKVCGKVMVGLNTDIEAAREAEAVAYAEWTQLTDTLKKRFPYKAPNVVEVRIADTLSHFPKGTTVEQAYGLLMKEGTISGGGSIVSRMGLKVVVPTLPNPAGKGRPISDIGNAVIQAPRVTASDANGSTLPHGNGQRAEMSQGQAIAAARAQ